MKKFIFSTVALLVAFVATAESRADKILREIRNPKSDYVVVIAHRGDWRNFPENSLEAFDSAIKMGVDVIELDVHRTADGHLVVCHDKTINRTTNGKGKISELSLDSIRNCSLRSGHNVVMKRYKMPTLEEALDLCKGRALVNIDKGINYYDQVIKMLVERDMVDQVIIKGSKSPDMMELFFSKHKENMLYMPIINYNSKSWEKHKVLFEEYLSAKLPFIAFEMCWNGTLPNEKEVFDKVLKSGKKLWVNTLWNRLCGGDENGLEDDEAVLDADKIYGKVLAYGTSMIQTDRPQLLIKYLESKGRHTLK